jgi:hypothetical protein
MILPNHYLNHAGKAKLKELVEQGKLTKTTPEELGTAYQGNVTLSCCGDGSKNIIQPLEWSIRGRLYKGHVDFGGPLWLVKSFPGFSVAEAERIRWKLGEGMKAVESGVLLDIFHLPCAMGKGLHVADIVRFAGEADLFLRENPFFQESTLVHLLHADYMERDIRIQEYYRIK